jgi:hypothetical protein
MFLSSAEMHRTHFCRGLGKLKSGGIQEPGWTLLTLGGMAGDVTANEGKENLA